jgi:hypothetical protein
MKCDDVRREWCCATNMAAAGGRRSPHFRLSEWLLSGGGARNDEGSPAHHTLGAVPLRGWPAPATRAWRAPRESRGEVLWFASPEIVDPNVPATTAMVAGTRCRHSRAPLARSSRPPQAPRRASWSTSSCFPSTPSRHECSSTSWCVRARWRCAREARARMLQTHLTHCAAACRRALRQRGARTVPFDLTSSSLAAHARPNPSDRCAHADPTTPSRR